MGARGGGTRHLLPVPRDLWKKSKFKKRKEYERHPSILNTLVRSVNILAYYYKQLKRKPVSKLPDCPLPPRKTDSPPGNNHGDAHDCTLPKTKRKASESEGMCLSFLYQLVGRYRLKHAVR
jgi:hypothetical protein